MVFTWLILKFAVFDVRTSVFFLSYPKRLTNNMMYWTFYLWNNKFEFQCFLLAIVVAQCIKVTSGFPFIKMEISVFKNRHKRADHVIDA